MILKRRSLASTPPARPGSLQPRFPLWAALVVAAVAGALMDLAFPSIGWWPMAFVATPLLLLALVGRSVWGAFGIGAAFSVTFYLIHIIWITRYLGLVPWFALSGLESLMFAAGSVAITLAYRFGARVLPSGVTSMVALPALVAGVWTALELWTGSWPYTGFPWFRLGMSQVGGPLAETASWVGVTGLTFLIAFASAVIVAAIARGGAWRDRARQVVPAVLVLFMSIVLPQFPTTDAGSLRVGAAQGNGPSGYFDDRSTTSVFQTQADATLPLIDDKLDLLVWPEGSVDRSPLEDDSYARALTRISKRIQAPVLANAAVSRGEQTFNTSFLWSGGRLVASHDKRNPVPMGEYVPDRWFFEALAPDLINLIQREYTPGTDRPMVRVGNVPVGLAICFDVIYDDVIWEGANDGAQLYVFQTNNADFRDTDENLQQLGFARMRAIETGRSVVNVSTVGTSQIMTPDGTSIAHIDAGVEGAMVQDVPLRTGLTPATVLGPWIQITLGWGSVLALVIFGLCHRRLRNVPANN